MSTEPEGTLDDLKGAIVDTLEHNKTLGKLRARMRAEVFKILEGPPDGVLHPPLSNENLFINELIRDYLKYNHYDHSLSVFLAESGQPNDRALDRGFMRTELGVTENKASAEKGLPLLYGVVDMLRRWRE
ncbi:unnamed protein product, partial [Choristocarpus tenellus]